jgi:hypothetical protein
MAIRHRRGAGLRRAARGRAGALALGAALYAAAALFVLAPDLDEAGSHFLAYGTPQPGGAVTPGDYLQSTYNFWLPGDQLRHGRVPWQDAYSFQPEASPRTNYAAWPFAIVFWPLRLLLGTVGAWNAFVFLAYVGAGACAALWLRSLGLGLGAALVGGLAFALAPYRSIQTAGGHLLAPISMLLPLALYGVERRLHWLAVAAVASIPLSGQVHLALGALPFFAAYALLRGRRSTALAGTAWGVGAALLVYLDEIRGSAGASGRTFANVDRYSAEVLDFVTRHARHGFETFVFLGWVLPIAAAAGGVLLARRDRRLAALLGVGAVVPVLLALGANTPLYEPLWDVVPGLHQTRVPGRLLPIAALCLAALVAFAIDRVRWRWAAAVAAVVVVADLRVDPYTPLPADEHNAVYASLSRAPDGRVLETRVVPPDWFAGSVYLYYAMQARRERPLGYSTTAPPEAVRAARRLRASPTGVTANRLGVRYVIRFADGQPRRIERVTPIGS